MFIGQELTQLSGVAAVLRFPLAEADVRLMEQQTAEQATQNSQNNTNGTQ